MAEKATRMALALILLISEIEESRQQIVSDLKGLDSRCVNDLSRPGRNYFHPTGENLKLHRFCFLCQLKNKQKNLYLRLLKVSKLIGGSKNVDD